jgi:large subunit ribosomal protein L25
MEVTLRARPRATTGKGSARQARRDGLVPAILYGRGMQPTPLAVNGKEMGHVLHTEAGANVLVNLVVEGGRRYLTMVREVQRHPVRGHLLHVDLVNTARDVKTHADVPVSIAGESRGVREGGVLEHHLWELRVEALPTDIPAALDVDISGLGIGEHLRVGDVPAPEGVEILTPPEEIIVSIVEPQAVRAAEELAAGEAGAGAGATEAAG